MATTLLSNSVESLSALASLINRLSEQGVRSTEDETYWETGVYALPNSSLSALSFFDHAGGLTLVVQDGDVEVFRLYGPSDSELELESDGAVTVYEGVQPLVNQLTAEHLEQLQCAIAQGL